MRLIPQSSTISLTVILVMGLWLRSRRKDC
ncbi:MAG: hypothetical protein EGQ06_02635 [Ruminococcaceae bacterium]|nr:hypothetical protein [Oscillospiraceae bacterium]HCG34211.1 hypothetical protein [Oscillospiraceae bacterium]